MSDEPLPSEPVFRPSNGENAAVPVLDEGRRVAILQAAATPDDTFDMNEYLKKLSRDDRD
jgi:hypothetical protein